MNKQSRFFHSFPQRGVMLLILFLLASAFMACSKQEPGVSDTASTSPPAEGSPQRREDDNTIWEQLIAHHDENWVSAHQAITIHFRQAIVHADQVGTQLAHAVSFQPDVATLVTAVDEKTLRIQPQSPLLSGQAYALSLHPDKLPALHAQNLPVYRFQIQALKQDFELRVGALVPENQQGTNAINSLMRLEGQVRTTDTANAEEIENTLKAEQQGQTLAISWEHDADGLNHSFRVTGIKRAEQNGNLRLHYQTSGLGLTKSGHQDINIPALEHFEITGVRSIQRPRQYVEVSFSEALDRNQNLNGLITLDGEQSSVRVDGSRLQIYPRSNLSGTVDLMIANTLRSSKGAALDKALQSDVTFISEMPGVRFVSSGSILPPSDNLTVPFEAINVDAVWVTAFKVYGNTLQNYIQNYQISSHYTDTRSGRYIWRKKIQLPSVPFDKWERFDIDLQELIQTHPDALLNLQVSIDRSTLAFPCPEDDETRVQEKLQNQSSENALLKNYDGPNMESWRERPDWFYRYYSNDNGYVSYEQRSDPCSVNYYSYYGAKNVKSARNILVTDLALLAKKGSDNTIHVVTSSLKTGSALAGTQIGLYNYQHQMLASAVSDNQGMAILESNAPGFYILAENNGNKNYLRLPRNEALPTSQFDTRGDIVNKGLKGFIYGERDIWRPGDKIFLSFMLEDKQNTLPPGHPVSLDFFDPRGNKHSTLITTQGVGAIYTFELETNEDSPTGNWHAVVRVGGEYFDKIIKVETITPNRLKVELEPSQRPIVTTQPLRTELFAQWLNGAVAKNLRADSEIKLSPMNTEFKGWSQYEFDDPASEFRSYSESVFDNTLNDEGRAAFNLNLSHLKTAPGKLRATFVTRVFEQSGAFSTTLRQEEVLPYDKWVGLYIPEGSGYRGAIARNQDHPLEFISINANGEVLANQELELRIYRIGWRWWWDQSDEDLSNYIRRSHTQALVDETLKTDKEGRSRWTLAKDSFDWGRHLIRVCLKNSGHCAGQEVYLGWSWNNQVNPDSATQLMLASDKERYQVGDTAKITLPAVAKGKLLISLENGSRIFDQRWLELKKDQNVFDLKITADMTPNVYLNAVLLQPHQQRESDAPIRMYGIAALEVEDKNTLLQPQITAPEQVRPQSEFEVSITESEGRAMDYTLALVDEGLLGISGFKAPNPHRHFYKREALGVLTWDMYDSVIGAYGANLEKLLRIGGGDSEDEDKRQGERRFPPVVQFLGAFQLKAGETRQHTIQLPEYMGAVRLMAVAAKDQAYGKAEESITVTQPLTLLATLPRVLGPNEEFSLPVNVFVSSPDIKDVRIEIETNNLFKVESGEQRFIFDKPGDQISNLKLKVIDQLGKGRVTVRAIAGNEIAEQTIHIDIRSPNVASTFSEQHVLQPGESWQASLLAHGMQGTNESAVVVSSLPPLNLEKRLNYLIRYPHGCVEQTTSAIFPQIGLHKLTQLSQQQQDDIQNNVQAALNKYRNFQNASGGFSYWPGNHYTNDWASTWVSHFLVEANKLGYPVNRDMLDKALTYLKNMQYQEGDYAHLVNAYRLYVLASGSRAELADMNRLRERLLQHSQHYNDQIARWMLASTYQKLGLSDIAEELMANDNTIEDYRYSSYTYGSSLRDRAILLSTYHGMKKDTLAWQTAKEIAAELSSENWYSTHSTAWALLALNQFAEKKQGDSSQFSLSETTSNGSTPDWQNLEMTHSFFRKNIHAQTLDSKALQIRNDSAHPLFVEVSNTGVPSEGKEVAFSEGLALDIAFSDMDGHALDIRSLPQGQDFIAEVTVKSTDTRRTYKLEDIAMSLLVPSGWQIRNQRLEGDKLEKGLDYQDIRDDAVLSYFSLWKNYYWTYRYNERNHGEQTIRVVLNASFAGKYYLPGWQVKSMYDENVAAQSQGQWIEVVAQN